MPSKSPAPLSPVLRAALDAVAKLIADNDVVNGASVADVLGIKAPAAHKRMEALTRLKLLHNAGAGRRPDWRVTSAGNASLLQGSNDGGQSEAKVSETPREPSTFAERLKKHSPAFKPTTAKKTAAAQPFPDAQPKCIPALAIDGSVVLFEGDFTKPGLVLTPYQARTVHEFMNSVEGIAALARWPHREY
jgi:hypothetical protein